MLPLEEQIERVADHAMQALDDAPPGVVADRQDRVDQSPRRGRARWLVASSIATAAAAALLVTVMVLNRDDSTTQIVPATTGSTPQTDETIPQSDPARELAAARERWAQSEPPSYIVDVFQAGGMLPGVDCTWLVHEGTITYVSGSSLAGDRCTSFRPRTPAEAFDRIADILNQPVGKFLKVVYDDRGVPIKENITIPDSYDLDSSWTMAVSSTDGVQLRNPALVCGPTDGAWISATVVSGNSIEVYAQVSTDGVDYGRSENMKVAAFTPAFVGFYPATPYEALGHTATLKIIDATTGDVLQTADFTLEYTPGTGAGFCG